MGAVFDLLIIITFLSFLWAGFKKGFFKSIIELLIMVASVMVSYAFAPILAERYYENFVYSDLLNKINSILLQGNAITDTVQKALNLVEHIPAFIINGLTTYGITINDVLKVLNGSGNKGEQVLELLKPVVIDIITLYMFALISVATFFVLKVIFSFLFKLPKFPVFGFIGSILGACIGALKFIVFIFVFIVILKAIFLLVPQEIMDQKINKGIEESKIFSQIYNINVDILEDYLRAH